MVNLIMTYQKNSTMLMAVWLTKYMNITGFFKRNTFSVKINGNCKENLIIQK